MSLRDLLPPGTFDEISKELENKNRAAVRTDVCPVCKKTVAKMQLTGSGHSAQKNAEPLIWVPGPAVITVCREKPLRKILRRTASRTQITATDFNGAVVLKLLSADCIKEYTQTDF